MLTVNACTVENCVCGCCGDLFSGPCHIVDAPQDDEVTVVFLCPACYEERLEEENV